MYYRRVTEPSGPSAILDETARDVVAAFHGMSPRVAQTPARDLTLGQVRLLILLRAEGRLPMGRIAQIFDLSPAASTGFVQRVERHGLVQRQHRSDDRRVVDCVLTDAGRHLLEDLSGIRLGAIRQALSVLQPSELAVLQQSLRLIRSRQEAVA